MIMNKKTIFLVKSSKGTWDDAHWWISGIFENKSDAEKLANELDKRIEEILNTPCPIDYNEETFDSLPKEEQYKYNDWWCNNDDARDAHKCEILEMPLNEEISE